MSTASPLSRIVPSLEMTLDVSVVAEGGTVEADALAVPVTSDGDVPEVLGVDLAALKKAGFEPEVGKAISFPSSTAPVLVAVGVGEAAALGAAEVRDAAAAFARAVPQDARLATRVPVVDGLDVAEAAAAVVEGAVLARYRFSLRSEHQGPVPLASLVLVAPEGALDQVRAGAERGRRTAAAACLGRDLAACPAGLPTATRMAEIAQHLAQGSGLEVEVHDKAAVTEMGLGGLLGVNKGSVEEPRMIVLRYEPEGEPIGHLALVGKGVMYDSGGISLKPSDLSHSQMKNDMTGAGDILAAMTTLAALGGTARVTGYLMCTDNMPSGSAMQVGDVLTIRGGRTVAVLNTDAEGRLVMADALVLAVEEGVDAIVNIATLTGQCLRTLGEEVAGLFANDDAVAAQVEAAAERADEQVWRLPLVRSYRKELDSEIADIKNMGGPNGGSIHAALFLEEFVDGTPWAHLDIAGTAQSSEERSWTNKGPTAFGVRLLVELAQRFETPARG